MTNIDIVVEKRKISYEGLFSMTELYKVIDEYFEELGYDKNEKRITESIREDGKFIEMYLEPFKYMSDYLRYRVLIKIVAEGIKEVEIEKDNRKIRLNKGKVLLIFDAYLESDYEMKWEHKPIYYFIRILYEKFFIGSYMRKHGDEVKQHCLDCMETIRAFLNLYRH